MSPSGVPTPAYQRGHSDLTESDNPLVVQPLGFEVSGDHSHVNITVLLALAWIAFLARFGVSFATNRRHSIGSLPGLSPLPEPHALRSRAAAFARQPVMRPVRGAAARRRAGVLGGLFSATLVLLAVALVTGSTVAWLLSLTVAVVLVAFVRALRVRALARRQAHIDRLWQKDRFDEVGHARVMSLEEARRRAVQIADPIFVPVRRIG